MIVRVTQPDSGMASHSVAVYLDGAYIGSVGPGESVSGESHAEPGTPWKALAVCGLYRAELIGITDANLTIQWSKATGMELRKTK